MSRSQDEFERIPRVRASARSLHQFARKVEELCQRLATTSRAALSVFLRYGLSNRCVLPIRGTGEMYFAQQGGRDLDMNVKDFSATSTDTQTTTRMSRHNWKTTMGCIAKQTAMYAIVVAMSYCFFQFSHRYLLQTVQVDGLSMSPTLPNEKCYLLNRIVYMIREPKTKDIVVLKDPETQGFAIKRIIARPGESVFMVGGKVFVNGSLVSESYLEKNTMTFTAGQYRAAMWVCGENQYFVLGDNRDNSADSRVYGVVPRQNILGMVTP